MKLPLKSQDGMTLLTKKKYCGENIDIIPELQVKEVSFLPEDQSITPDPGYAGLKEVKVEAIPDFDKYARTDIENEFTAPQIFNSATVLSDPTSDYDVTRKIDLDKKRDRITPDGTYTRVYSQNKDGTESSIIASTTAPPQKGTIPLRNDNGNIVGYTAVGNTEYTPLSQVKAIADKKLDKITSITERAYIASNNQQSSLPIASIGTTSFSLAKRDNKGNFYVGNVTPDDSDQYVANIKYVKDNTVSSKGGTVDGNLAVTGNLTVSGTTTTEKEEQLLVKANVIATNADKIDLQTLLSGLAINKNADATYGIMYDPTDDTVKFGEGTLDADNKFEFKDGEGHPLAIRADSAKFTDAHLVRWDADTNSFVDAGLAITDLSSATNIQNSDGTGAIKQIDDPKYTAVAIKTKNPNAYALDNSLTDEEPVGATGDYASAFGGNTSAQGKRAMSQGTSTLAKGNYSHAEGDNSAALGNDSHAEGYATTAKGQASHSEGTSTVASGTYSHAEGNGTKAIGEISHAEGVNTKATGKYAHAEGNGSEAFGMSSFAAGTSNYSVGTNAATFGYKNTATGNNSFVTGNSNNVPGSESHSEGTSNEVNSANAHAEGYNNKIYTSLAVSSGGGSSGGGDTPSIPSDYNIDEHMGENAHIEGWGNQSLGFASHAEGGANKAWGHFSHVEGTQNTTGTLSESGNQYTVVGGQYAHAEGVKTSATGTGAHSEGGNTIASGNYAHAQGDGSEAKGIGSDAGGNHSTANGDYSLARGSYVVTRKRGQSALGVGIDAGANSVEGGLFIGHYNSPRDNTILQIGNGTDSTKRKNALTIYEDGKVTTDIDDTVVGVFRPTITTEEAPPFGDLIDNYEYILGDAEAVEFNFPETLSPGFRAVAVFNSGTEATIFYTDKDCQCTGTHCKNGEFVPQPNMHYVVIYWYDGTKQVVVRGVPTDGTNYPVESGATIGTIGDTNPPALEKVVYCAESDIPENPVEGVEYACTDYIKKEDLDATLQAEIDGKQAKLTFDTTPSASSTNPVTSAGIYNAIANFVTIQVSDSLIGG